MLRGSLFYFNVRRPFIFPKSNKLKSIISITRLFETGSSDFSFPVKLVFNKSELNGPFETYKATVSVPKKIFKKAVDRNTIKRRLRESIRLNQEIIYQYCIQNKCVIHFMLIYVGKEILPGQQMDKAVRSLFEKMIKDV